jgi:hypothetical protein
VTGPQNGRLDLCEPELICRMCVCVCVCVHLDEYMCMHMHNYYT